MAYVLLAIGALMALAGVYAAATGYPIIQVEQGWASVISGATLIAGGAVTLALGLVLRTLLELKAATVGRLPAPGSPSEHSIEPAVAPVGRRPKRSAAKEEAVAAPATEPAPPVDPTERPIHETFEPAPVPHLHETEPQVPASVAEVPETHIAPPPSPADPHPAYEAAMAAHVEPAGESHVAEAEVAPPDMNLAPAVPPAAEVQPAQLPEEFQPNVPASETAPVEDRLRQAPEPVAEEIRAPEPQAVPGDAPETQNDWLDRALAEIDRDGPPPPAKSAPPVKQVVRIGLPSRRPAAVTLAPEPDPVLPPVPEPAFAEGPAEIAAANEAASPSAAAPAPAPTSAVIGRYEADGTSYVMYADGSIEAQSDAGVYRFASMTELKAFIES